MASFLNSRLLPTSCFTSVRWFHFTTRDCECHLCRVSHGEMFPFTTCNILHVFYMVRWFYFTIEVVTYIVFYKLIWLKLTTLDCHLCRVLPSGFILQPKIAIYIAFIRWDGFIIQPKCFFCFFYLHRVLHVGITSANNTRTSTSCFT